MPGFSTSGRSTHSERERLVGQLVCQVHDSPALIVLVPVGCHLAQWELDQMRSTPEVMSSVSALSARSRVQVAEVGLLARTVMAVALPTVGVVEPATARVSWPGSQGTGPVGVGLLDGAGVAEGLAEGGRVQLVDYSEPARSGLAAAPTIELGIDGAGWRCGRRGRLDVVRLARRSADGALPRLPEADADATVVVDAGWSTTCALLDPSRSLVGCALVVVTRVTVPAVRQAEHVLATVGAEAAVAAVGPARWPRLVEASCGARLREARSTGQVVSVPFDQRLQTAGLTGDRLPKSVAAAGRALAELVMPAASPRHRRQPARTGRAGGIR